MGDRGDPRSLASRRFGRLGRGRLCVGARPDDSVAGGGGPLVAGSTLASARGALNPWWKGPRERPGDDLLPRHDIGSQYEWTPRPCAAWWRAAGSRPARVSP